MKAHFKPGAKAGRYTALCLLLIFTILLADQYTKWLVAETALRVEASTPDTPAGPGVSFYDWFLISNPLPYFADPRYTFRSITVTPWLNFVMVWNQGVSFGLFNGAPSPWIFVTTSSAISLALLGWLSVTRSLFTSLCITLIVGGAAGNMMDRMRFGAVADFIDLHWQGYHWPAFNLADSYIVLGAAMLAIEALINGDGKDTKEGTKLS